MGFLKGSATFRRYRVAGDLPPNFNNVFDDRIKLHAFREMTAEPAEKNLGWTSIENILDNNFEYANYRFGEFLLFALRVDRIILPPSLLRVRTMEAEQQYLREKGLKKLFREQRQDLRENVRRALLKSTPPVPSWYEVCWAPFQEWVLFGSLSEKAAEDFEKQFKATFSLQLVPYTPWNPDPATTPEQPEQSPRG